MRAFLFSIPLSAALLRHLAFATLLLAFLSVCRPAYLAFRRSRAGYGVVFDSITGIPESLVSIRLITPQGQLVSTAVSDKHGRYRLLARPGQYVVEVAKDGYTFPSKYLKQHSSIYENILPSAKVIIKEYGMITKSIPLDPIESVGRSKVFGRRIHVGKRTQYLLAYASPFVFVIYPLWSGAWVAWGMFWAYVGVVLYRLFTHKPGQPAFGIITDRDSHEVVPRAVVRIFDARVNKLLETQVTGPRGRYAFVVRPGSYYVTIEKPGYRRTRINFPEIKQDAFTLAKDIHISRVALSPSTPTIAPAL
ncbi:MAG: hypothetical protein RL141_57 [Candidatus Parcubacteria bacterium]|jgi:hypothetical protein